MIDFSQPTDRMYEVFGVAATYAADESDAGTEITVLFDHQGTDDMGYGRTEAARIVARREDVPGLETGYASFVINGTTWTTREILSATDGTNELELALYCTAGARFGGGNL